MLKPIKDQKVYEALATLATTGHGKTLTVILKEELDAIKSLWLAGDGTGEEMLRGRAKSLNDVILLLENAEDTAEKLKRS